MSCAVGNCVMPDVVNLLIVHMYIDTVECKMEAYWHDYQNLVRVYIFTDSVMHKSLQFSVSNYHDSSEIQTIILHEQ